MSKFGDYFKKKGATKAGLKTVDTGVKKAATRKLIGKTAGKIASRAIPGLGWGMLAVDAARGLYHADKEAPKKQLKKRAKSKSYNIGRKI